MGAAGTFGTQFNGLMQPFDDTLYSGYSTYNNWAAKTPSLTKGFSWGLGAMTPTGYATTTTGAATTSQSTPSITTATNMFGGTSSYATSGYGSMYGSAAATAAADPGAAAAAMPSMSSTISRFRQNATTNIVGQKERVDTSLGYMV